MEIKHPIVCKKTYTITLTEYENNITNVMRENSGFSVFEIVGLMQIIIDENKNKYISESIKTDSESPALSNNIKKAKSK